MDGWVAGVLFSLGLHASCDMAKGSSSVRAPLKVEGSSVYIKQLEASNCKKDTIANYVSMVLALFVRHTTEVGGIVA